MRDPSAASGPPSFVHLSRLAPAGATLVIEGDEAHYLSRVVRVRAGETVRASDGGGGVATLEVLAVTPRVEVRVASREQRVRSAELEIWCGAPEGERADWMIEKLAELGAARLLPLQAERGAWNKLEARRERWERLAIAAMRQSLSPWRLEVLPPATLDAMLARADRAGARWLCQPGGGSPPGPGVATGTTIAVVGPSSGFSDAELKRLREQGFTDVGLSSRRLRTETAALAIAALWACAGPSADTEASGGAGLS
jgi:16S rRNA (uracil1498-N3)-methyltransferase